VLMVRRAVAFAVDCALLFLVLVPAGQLVRFGLGWPYPSTGPGIWLVVALNLSLPTWTYFILSDSAARGATAGKRLLGLSVVRVDGGRVELGRALGRTAIKLLPWETVHVSLLALSSDPTRFAPRQWVGLAVANILMVAYLVVAAWTRGRRSVHDYAAKTEVRSSPARGGGSGHGPKAGVR
jgi:uncharacterized RDD family membrane protein YckC